ncbi:hypothetical protein HBB16_02810 [Pseudonocardia sp. MCCB 268]|nr:hypothetical protein [Pseudonocardia cytotoxica]
MVRHAVLFLQQLGLVPPPSPPANMALASLRMPLFISSCRALPGRSVDRSWRAILHKQIRPVRLPLRAVDRDPVRGHGPAPADPDVFSGAARERPVDQHCGRYSLPAPSMWFLYALALYSVLASSSARTCHWRGWGHHRRPVRRGRSRPAGTDDTCRGLAARYLFFFLLGFHARTVVGTARRRVHPGAGRPRGAGRQARWPPWRSSWTMPGVPRGRAPAQRRRWLGVR